MGVKSASLAIALTVFALAGCVSRPAAPPPAGLSTYRAPDGTPKDGSAAVVPDAAATMVGTATAMLGQPYRYGGAAPGGFDCSGLVIFAAQSAGVALPRTAHEQLHAGVSIDRPELAPGDLVFMRLARKELHVGIAIGGGRFIHAPATGGRVRVDSLAAAPYSAGFIGARRVITARAPPGS